MTPADSTNSYLLYIGTGTDDPEEGIHALRFDATTGVLTRARESVVPLLNPTFLALSPDARFLYAISESAQMGSVHAYQVDGATGALTFLNKQSTGGRGPAYVSTDQTGRWLLVANYGGGSVALLPVAENGQVEAAVDVVAHTGAGPRQDRQEAPHAHYVHVSPDNRYAYAADLGIDRVRVYTLDSAQRSLTSETPREVVTAPGAGPRHLDFHPNGRYAYLVNELDGTVTAYTYDAATGDLTALQTLSALPDGFDQHNQSADIHVHPSGRWLYVSNRGDYDSIAVFAIDAVTGHLTATGYQDEGIHWPRNFAIDPTGRFLLVANRHADEVNVFEIDLETGYPAPTPHRIAVPGPTNITFVVADTVTDKSAGATSSGS